MTKMEKQGYMGAKREQIVIEYGYDIKNAAHCIRLLLGGCELAERSRLVVKLEGEDLELVLSVKKGERSFEWVQDKARELFVRFDEAKEKCDLPEIVSRDFTNDLTFRLISLYWEDRE